MVPASEEDQNESPIDEIAIKSQAKQEFEKEDSKFSPIFASITSLIVFVTFITVSVITFAIVDAQLHPNSADVKTWKANFSKGGCGEMDMTNAL